MDVEIEITGWNADDEAVYWEGRGSSEEEALADALRRSGIVEIGDVRVIRGEEDS